MTERTRSRVISSGVAEGEFRLGGYVFEHAGPGPIFQKEETCIDTADLPGQTHNLHIESFDQSGWTPLYGDLVPPNTFAGSYLHNGWYDFRNVITHLSVGLELPTEAEDITKLVAMTNPSRPGITPLSLAQDLIDLPRMLKDVGRLIRSPKKVLRDDEDLANHYLAHQFGWVPFVNDIKQVLNLQSQIHRRASELQRLYTSNVGLRRRLHMGSVTAEASQSNYWIAGWPSLQASVNIHRLTKAERWGTVRWLPTTPPPFNPQTGDFNAIARQVVSGFTIEGLNKGAWDLLPWSFIVDWFTDVGTYMQAFSNTVPAVPVDACIMTHYKTTATITRDDSNGVLTGGNGVITRESKYRYTGMPSLNASIPFMSGWRLSIVKALNSQRLRRRRLF